MDKQQFDILQPYCENDMRLLKKLSQSIFMRFNEPLTRADYDDFYSIANLTLWQCYNTYNSTVGVNFEGYLYSCLQKKFKTELTRRHRQKRVLDQFNVALDITNNEEEYSLLDVLPSNFDTFEAYYQGLNDVQVMKLNPVKDDTDTEFVIREAIRRGATEITVLGATGTRLDHVLANVNLLGIGLEEDVTIQLVDKHNRIRMISDRIEIAKKEQFGDYVSVLPVKGDAKGVTLEGMKYPLKEADIACFSSLGVSNEIVEDIARISVKQGTLLIIESRD